MTDFFSLPKDEREQRENRYGGQILEICAERALAGEEVCMQLLERFAPRAESNGNRDCCRLLQGSYAEEGEFEPAPIPA